MADNDFEAVMGVPLQQVLHEGDLDAREGPYPYNSTQQFRCVSVYGVTDHVNAVDPDQPEGAGLGEFRIESEVLYQLDEVFNPVDLIDAADKDNFRWAQKGIAAEVIPLEAHLYDKYGNYRECLRYHEIVVPEKWGYYCRESEKVILKDSTGLFEDKLLNRDDDYTVVNGSVVIELGALAGYDRYKVLYTTRKLMLTGPWREDEFTANKYEFDVELSKECDGHAVTWRVQMSDLGAHTSTGVQVIIADDNAPLFTLGWSPGESTTDPVYKPYNGGWGAATTTLPQGMTVSGNYNEDFYEITIPVFYLGHCYRWAVNVEATSPGHFPDSSSNQMHFPADWVRWTEENTIEDCCLPWHKGRWEWTVIGDFAKPSDSLGAAMLSSAWAD